jgi:rifampin ADP-ribosylating transferase
MEFSPDNKVVKLCLLGQFDQAWNEAVHDFEKFISAYFLARHADNDSDRLRWLETALKLALDIGDDRVKSALPPLYTGIAECHERLREAALAKKYFELARSIDVTPTDPGPFYHGTKADLKIGDYLQPGENSNYQLELKMNHIYFTAVANGAGLAAELAQGEREARVYQVVPTGPFENDPNLTNSRFPGNPTRSYRSTAPLKIVGEVTDWPRLTPMELKKWREKLAAGTGKIIN